MKLLPLMSRQGAGKKECKDSRRSRTFSFRFQKIQFSTLETCQESQNFGFPFMSCKGKN